MAPPAVPRPNIRPDGPLSTCTSSIIETVAGIGGEVAQAVEIDVILGVEAVDLELVARQRAAFADGDGDAGHVAQRLAQGGGGLFLHGLGIDHVDRLRRVLDRGARHRRHRRAVGERVAVGIVLHRDRSQLDRRGAVLRLRRRDEQQGQRRSAAQHLRFSRK